MNVRAPLFAPGLLPGFVPGARPAWPCLPLLALLIGWQTAPEDTVYTRRLSADGIPILATEAVHEDYLVIAAQVYEHMTSREGPGDPGLDPRDLRALHRASGFRILLITEEESFLDLPEYAGEDEELDQAGGLGGSIGEFFVAVRVGSPHALVHELGHGIYHSAIQFDETGGAEDEEAWYAARVEAVHDLGLEAALERFGEEQIHEVLLAPAGTFSADLADAWRHADEHDLWAGEYASTEPNEYWAEGVALWFRAWTPGPGDPRELLRERDPRLHALCARLFPDTDWSPAVAHAASGGRVRFEDEPEDGGEALAALFDVLDRDGDGRIGTYEGAEAWLWLAAEAGHGDGSLESRELFLHLERLRDEEHAEREGFFEELDRDADGRLTNDELPDDVRPLLAAADHDEDGVVTLDELQQADELGEPRAMFEAELRGFLQDVDQDGDGAFALADLPAEEQAGFREEFEHLDVDRDGLLTEPELLAVVDEELRGATFDVRGDTAVMSGVIGASTPGRVLELALEHPEVDVIVMREVPGSIDDESNLRAAALVRRLGLATHVPADGEVASGGTDFFLAGARRTAEPGALFGVHSWGGFGEEGADVPRDDPEHDKYLEYYRAMGIDEEFYWYTLEAAGADDIHWMTPEELERYGFFTGD